ncbi:MAG TPA: SLC13 family permease [Anaerolineales bacterium]
MILGLTASQILLLVILLLATVVLSGEWIRVDLSAVLIILALSISRVLTPEEALSGFSSEPAILVASVFVMSGALYRTGLSERFGTWIKGLVGDRFERIVAVIMPLVALPSAFTHHVTMTAIMVPVVLKISREKGIPASKLLMPMSFAASLGTTMVIIGAPAFLIANGLLKQAGRPGLGIFSIAPIGLALMTAGTLFVILTGRWLLPSREGDEEATEHFRLDGYYTELVLLPDSPMAGKTIEELEAGKDVELKVVRWFRNGAPRARPYGKKRTRSGDVLLVRSNPDHVVSVHEEKGVAIHSLHKYGEEVPALPDQEDGGMASALVQAVVAPRSELIGKTIGRVDFLHNYGVIVVSVWRRTGRLRSELARARIREGDILVMTGDAASLRRIAEDRSFLLLTPFQGEKKPLHKAPLTAIIMLLSIAAASLNLLPVQIAFLAGAAAMVLFRCLTVRQAYQSIDTRIFVFIAGAIPLGLAMQSTGTAALLAGWLQHLVAHWDVHWTLLVLFMTAGLITQLMSDSATTALLAPVAIALAHSLNAPPEPYVVAVAMASVASFFTPIGHHGNLLIYGPGNYQFNDFLRVGIPLTLLVAGIVVLIAPMLWPG